MAQGIGLRTPVSERPHRVRWQIGGTPVADGDGDYTQSFTDCSPPETFVAIRPASAADHERVGAETVISMTTYLVTGPFHPQLTTAARMLYRGKTFNVLGVSSTDARDVDSVVLVAEVL